MNVTLFISHGAPTFALEPGQAGAALAALGRTLPRPQAVLMVSSHWMTPTPRVGLAAQPKTIHDFGGFDPALYRIEYPAPGHPALAQKTLDTLIAAGWPAVGDELRGLDHGAWVPMRHLYPLADVPVFQVSLPSHLDANAAWSLGQALSPMSREGVLIMGSGSLTHNLGDYRGDNAPELPYVHEFSSWVREAVATKDSDRLRRTLDDAPQALRAHPTPEHFWPLLVAAGAAPQGQDWRMLDGGIAYGMLAMDSIIFGGSSYAGLEQKN